jgi:hypothetical protein
MVIIMDKSSELKIDGTSVQEKTPTLNTLPCDTEQGPKEEGSNAYLLVSMNLLYTLQVTLNTGKSGYMGGG